MAAFGTISPQKLARLTGTPKSSAIIDVRTPTSQEPAGAESSQLTGTR